MEYSANPFINNELTICGDSVKSSMSIRQTHTFLELQTGEVDRGAAWKNFRYLWNCKAKELSAPLIQQNETLSVNTPSNLDCLSSSLSSLSTDGFPCRVECDWWGEEGERVVHSIVFILLTLPEPQLEASLLWALWPSMHRLNHSRLSHSSTVKPSRALTATGHTVSWAHLHCHYWRRAKKVLT